MTNHTTSLQDHTVNITEVTNFREIIDQYRNAVHLAKQAGFDGVEILAQGYVKAWSSCRSGGMG
jgi:2,4-dienoyl-CoA reductase-like NADH-dependent reductase (Old Yellow Enzyme family)